MNVLEKADLFYSTYKELVSKLTQYKIGSADWIRLNTDVAKMVPLAELYEKYLSLNKEFLEYKEFLISSDTLLQKIAIQETNRLSKDIDCILQELTRQLTLKVQEINECILEIRAGVGGDEASLFASTLFNMYANFCTKQKVSLKVLSQTKTTNGGLKEIICELTGKNIYNLLKFESGGHRVQRVPETESKGRLHTSTVTVAVLPKTEIADITINPQDIRVDVFRSSGAGGQHVNKTESAVRLTHLPTGLVVVCQDERSQKQNKDQAYILLYNKLKEFYTSKSQQKLADTRKSLVGSGDRNDKIRTYNFPQDRITDHRIGLSIFGISKVLSGELESLLSELSNQLED